MPTGTVKWFDEGKGYGFIVPDDGNEDVFLHYLVLLAAGIGEILPGERLEFQLGTNPKNGKPCAGQLKRAHGWSNPQ